jgi:hypothetical protein
VCELRIVGVGRGTTTKNQPEQERLGNQPSRKIQPLLVITMDIKIFPQFLVRYLILRLIDRGVPFQMLVVTVYYWNFNLLLFGRDEFIPGMTPVALI